MEAQLRKDADTIPGFFMSPSDAGFGLFKTHHMDEGTLEDNRVALAFTDALTILKNSRNLTKSQVKFCMKQFSLSKFCTPKKIECNSVE